MLLYHFDVVCKSVLALLLLLFACMGYTYLVNLLRKPDDPKKRKYHPFAILLAPFTFLVFLSLGIFVFILRALLFAGFLAIFTILLVTFRKLFIFIWWDKFATKIGDPLLRVNTELIRMAFGLWSQDSRII